YYAQTGERVWMELSARPIDPDVELLRTMNRSRSEAQDASRVAVASPTVTEPVIIRVPRDERGEVFLEIYARHDSGEQLVCSIEVLSPSNKAPGETGRDLYLRKQREILQSQVHLVEIDLLRAGVHTTAVPRNHLMARAGAFD